VENQNFSFNTKIFFYSVFLVLITVLVAFVVYQFTDLFDREIVTTQYIGNINDRLVTLEEYETEVNLEKFRSALNNQPESTVDPSQVLGRMVDYALLKQGAVYAGVMVENSEVKEYIENLLSELNMSETELQALLNEQNVTQEDFSNSIQDFLIILHFVDSVLLADVAPDQWQVHFAEWMAGQYQSSEINFETEFINSISQ